MTDPAGASATATVHISVGNTPPVATITAPTEGAKYRAGVPVTLAGSGTDKEDGTLSDAKLSWHVILVHARPRARLHHRDREERELHARHRP